MATQDSSGWEAEILAQLDDAAEELTLPGPPNLNFEYATMRLTSFRSASEWLLVFEEIHYSVNEGRFLNTISAFGSHVDPIGWRSSAEVVTGVPGCQLLDDSFNLMVDVSKPIDLLIKGQFRSIQLQEKDLQRVDVVGRGVLRPADFLRILTVVARQEFFLDEKELLSACERDVEDLGLFLRLDEWQHPDLVVGELPSGVPCFRSLAKALQEGDSASYECPKEAVNTDWWHWVDGRDDEEADDLKG